ncbi:hypothetical protein EYF80_065631 [Liparis tanakae]|uniref:Uncharacterized protein n=1 Tax=Liparis tanakae TaxID=230148 RepID=A0A4Z2E5P8_9TELE|nr:hypothetical protein EYF80_065631 [Liparis tanakae]
MKRKVSCGATPGGGGGALGKLQGRLRDATTTTTTTTWRRYCLGPGTLSIATSHICARGCGRSRRIGSAPFLLASPRERLLQIRAGSERTAVRRVRRASRSSSKLLLRASFCSFWPLAVRLVMLLRQARTPARWSSDPAASFISSSSLSGGFSTAAARRFFSGSVSPPPRARLLVQGAPLAAGVPAPGPELRLCPRAACWEM